MNPLLRLETMLREAFERPIWALGGQRLHPAQLGELLEDRMREGRVGLAGGTYVPERYKLLLSPDDAARLGEFRGQVEQGLVEHLEGIRQAEGYSLRAPLQVTIVDDAAVHPGQVEVDASYIEEPARGPALRMSGFRNESAALPPLDGATVAIDRKSVLAAIGRSDDEEPSAEALAVLVALGPNGEERQQYGIEAVPCVIGRSPECDIMLNDMRVSRRHVRIERDGEALVLEDLESANGVAVNGVSVGRTSLSEGDELVLGGPRFRVHLRP